MWGCGSLTTSRFGFLATGVRVGAINDEQFADVLNSGGIEFVADAFEVSQAIFPAIAIDAYLDQLMRLEVGINFLEDAIGEAIFGNGYNGVHAVGASA